MFKLDRSIKLLTKLLFKSKRHSRGTAYRGTRPAGGIHSIGKQWFVALAALLLDRLRRR